MMRVPEATAETRQSSHTYVVRDRELTREGCLLVIEDCTGALETVTFRAIPDRSGARQLHRDGLHPLAVKLDLDRQELSASCVVRSSDGPMRVGISPATALALCCVEGRHTILVRRGAARRGDPGQPVLLASSTERPASSRATGTGNGESLSTSARAEPCPSFNATSPS